MKPSAVGLLRQRVDQAGLHNVTAQLGHIEEYTGVLVFQRLRITIVCVKWEGGVVLQACQNTGVGSSGHAPIALLLLYV